MDFKTNCSSCGQCKHKLGVQQNNRTSFKLNLEQGQVQRTTHLGREFAIVPVIMVKAGVVMNDSLVPTDELHPITWNGVPVTVGHPAINGNYVSANYPSVIEDWAVGAIYNTSVEGGDLKAEAWLDIERINKVRPGLIDELENGVEMDVSTGYFSDDIEESGSINGNSYSIVSRNLNPDHLALLPDVSGACSWQDGCGVRANERSTATMSEPDKTGDEKVSVNAVTRILHAMGIGREPKTNERGADDDFRQMVADLISNDKSPFLPDDEFSLREMSYDTLKRMRDDYLGDGVAANKKTPDEPKPDEDEDDPKANKDEGGQEVAETKDKAKVNVDLPQTRSELDTLIANAVATGVAEALKTNAATGLSAEEREAVNSAVKANAERRQDLVASITANSDMTAETIKDWPTRQLELIANGLRVPTNFGARGQAPVVNAADDDIAVNAMIPEKLDFSGKNKGN